jgi:hypothetical protein
MKNQLSQVHWLLYGIIICGTEKLKTVKEELDKVLEKKPSENEWRTMFLYSKSKRAELFIHKKSNL